MAKILVKSKTVKLIEIFGIYIRGEEPTFLIFEEIFKVQGERAKYEKTQTASQERHLTKLLMGERSPAS